jgi:GntR family transcriptional regulator of arabinose operon
MTGSSSREKISYKYAQIRTDLSIKILDGTLRPHERILSLNEIADGYGGSKITARRVLNDLVAEGLVYTIRGKGSFVADTSAYPRVEGKAANENIGVVFENAPTVFMSALIRGIDEEIYEMGSHINLCLSNDSYSREAEILNRLVQQGVKRILLFMVIDDDPDALNPNVPLYLSLRDQGVRILQIDCYLPDLPLPAIAWDNYGGMKNLVEYFYRRGHRNLAYVTRTNNAVTVTKRMEGFKDGLLEWQLPFRPSRILRISGGGGEGLVENTARSVREFLVRDPEIDGILCSDELVASGVFQALHREPSASREVRVGGFGNPNTLLLQGDHPYVALVQDNHRLGRMAGGMIFNDHLLDFEKQGSALRQVLPVPIHAL